VRLHHVTSRVAAGCAAALFFAFLGCGAGVVEVEQTPVERSPKAVSPDQVMGASGSDMTDHGGQMQSPGSPCEGGKGVVYRYVARTFGAQARMDEFCVGDEHTESFAFQPTPQMEGGCPTKLCGDASTSRRGPIEHALLQSIVSLERSKATRVKTMHRKNEDLHDLYEVDIIKGSTRFRLSEGIHCVANLETFKEHADRVTAGHDAATSADLAFFYQSEATIANGTIWVEQKQQGDAHTLMVIIESKFEGYHDAELFKETILCKSKVGAISVRSSPVYGFRATRLSIDEWGVYAFRR
jgi:hypothetical protein